MGELAEDKSDMERLNENSARFGAGYAVMREALAGEGVARLTLWVGRFILASAAFVIGAAVWAGLTS